MKVLTIFIDMIRANRLSTFNGNVKKDRVERLIQIVLLLDQIHLEECQHIILGLIHIKMAAIQG